MFKPLEVNFKSFKLIEIYPRIFLLKFKEQYDCALTFLRYQEFYESPNPKFRNKSFKILDYISWYSKTYGNGNFTYPTDFVGFNIPGGVIEAVGAADINDCNIYDEQMFNVYWHCYHKYKDKNFYLVGACLKDNNYNKTLKHEIAHAFYYLNKDYRQECLKLIANLDSECKSKIKQKLFDFGYCKAVINDEIQAYLSTSSKAELLKTFGVGLANEQLSFAKLLNTYIKNVS